MEKAELPAISVARTRAHFIPFGKSKLIVFLPYGVVSVSDRVTVVTFSPSE